MKQWIADASVVVKLFFDEEHSIAARHHATESALIAPDLIWVECANVIWKRLRRREINAQNARDIAAQLLQLPLEIHPSTDLIADALELAIATERTVYDCLYLALAVSREIPMLTADRKLFNAVEKSGLKRHIYFVGQAR